MKKDQTVEALANIITQKLFLNIAGWVSHPVLYKVTYHGKNHYILGSMHLGVNKDIQQSLTKKIRERILPEINTVYFEDKSFFQHDEDKNPEAVHSEDHLFPLLPIDREQNPSNMHSEDLREASIEAAVFKACQSKSLKTESLEIEGRLAVAHNLSYKVPYKLAVNYPRVASGLSRVIHPFATTGFYLAGKVKQLFSMFGRSKEIFTDGEVIDKFINNPVPSNQLAAEQTSGILLQEMANDVFAKLVESKRSNYKFVEHAELENFAVAVNHVTQRKDEQLAAVYMGSRNDLYAKKVLSASEPSLFVIGLDHLHTYRDCKGIPDLLGSNSDITITPIKRL